MTIQRFHDETIDQYSYLVSQNGEAIAIDPSRNIHPYLEYLKEHKLMLVGIALTHCPGTYASGWAELREKTRATLLAAGKYRFHGEGEYLPAGQATMFPFGDGSHLQTQLTPGFTADSICLLAIDSDRKVHGIFTGCALLNMGAGYPLPRPEDKNPLHDKKTYAKELYASIRNKISGFAPRATVYAGFGEDAQFSKMGDSTHAHFNLTEAKAESPVFEQPDEKAFVSWLLEDYPFVPAYVAGCQENNPDGYPSWSRALSPFRERLSEEHRDGLLFSDLDVAPAAPPKLVLSGEEVLMVDTRNVLDFRAGHPENALNIQADGPFGLWLGSIVGSRERLHVLVDDAEAAYGVASAIAKIGYDEQVVAVSGWAPALAQVREKNLDLGHFKEHQVGGYTVVDVRPKRPAIEDTRFYGAINIPVWTLRKRWPEIPTDRPIVVHCGGGYHSAIGTSILRKALGDRVEVYDLGEHVKGFKAKR